ncbi:MAG: TlyA family RNA methyltransferase, partial [Clostridia bacterium]|nr:TlyA family RNA methyltransferase [Clostridia bacterium]
VVRDRSVHAAVVAGISEFALEEGFDLLGLDYSPVKGPEGNIEYLMFIRKSDAPERLCDVSVTELVESSHNELDKQG